MPDAESTSRPDSDRRPFLIAAAAGLAVLVLVAVLMKTGVLDVVDERIANLFSGRSRQPLTAVAQTLDKLDTWWLLAILIAIVVGGLWWSGRMAQAVYVGLTMAAALVLNPLLKLAFARQAPGSGAIEPAIYAFPSGHTTATAAVVTALAVVAWRTSWRWPVAAAAAVLAVTMAVSRVYLGAHWPSDVVGGLALGFTTAMAVRAVTPWPAPAAGPEAPDEDRSGATSAVRSGAAAGDAGAAAASPAQTIDVVFLDWGNTLMVDTGMREGPMKGWEEVEAEAGAQEALLRLSARYRLVVATNAEDSPAPDVRLALSRVGLDGYVDDVVSSADVGDHKPNYAFYRAALLREGSRGLPLDPRRAVMVGDGTSNDIAGAQRAGLHTIWYNPSKRTFPDGAQPPDAIVRKLTDLPQAVDRLAGIRPQRRSRKQRRADAEAAATAAAAAAARDLRAETAAEDAALSAAAAIKSGVTQEQPAPDGAAETPAGRDTE